MLFLSEKGIGGEDWRCMSLFSRVGEVDLVGINNPFTRNHKQKAQKPKQKRDSRHQRHRTGGVGYITS